MDGRERFLTALHNQKPDRLPAQVHSWMQYYLDTYLGGMDQWQAYEYMGMDPVIYTGPEYHYNPQDMASWQVDVKWSALEADGSQSYVMTIATPGGTLTEKGKRNAFTQFITDYMIKTPDDFELFRRYAPLPSLAWTPVHNDLKRLGNRGITRGGIFGFGQGSPWQDLSNCMMGTEAAIYMAMDDPDWMHYALNVLLEKKMQVIAAGGKIPLDLVDTGGGGGSSTVISPKMHREFCLPYDQKLHAMLHDLGARVVYHLCGGLMPLLEIVVENGADGLETMTPPSMGGDCDLKEAERRVGDKLFFIGGFDQNAGFEHGSVENVRKQVRHLFECCPNGGYICCPSDHFFFGDPAFVRAFSDAAKECKY